jgi:hypothetical protein
MRNRRSAIITLARAAAVAFVFVALASPLAVPAFAGALDDAKRDGLMGERPDGYLGLVDPDAPPAAQQLIDDVNARRRAHYADIAKKTGSSVRDVGILAGSKLIANAPPGTFVMDAAGHWQRK